MFSLISRIYDSLKTLILILGRGNIIRRVRITVFNVHRQTIKVSKMMVGPKVMTSFSDHK